MSSPIRTPIHVVTELPDGHEEWTLRQAVEWYKNAVDQLEPLGMLTTMENQWLNEAWVRLVEALAKLQGVPAGLLSYFLGELAQTEIKLRETAARELAEAVPEDD